ncbi:MAG: tetratricopeptide repeat protein [Bradymonadaceae bacterium]
MLKGRLAFARRDYAEARKFFERAQEINKDDFMANVMLGHTLVRLGENGPADRLLRDLLSAPVWGGHAWLALGELRRRQGRFQDANTNLTRARERLSSHIIPPRIEALIDVELALAWQRHRNWDHARVEQYLDAARQHSDEDFVEVLLAQGQFELGKRRRNLPAARRALEKATELDPNLCEAWSSLRQVYQAQRARAELRGIRGKMPESCR